MKLEDIIHKCKYLNTDDIYIYKEMNPVTRKYDWKLSMVREATEKDLEESSYFEEIGDHVWQLTTEISYCPYCGEKLKDPKKIKKLEETKTIITDNSADWYGKVLKLKKKILTDKDS